MLTWLYLSGNQLTGCIPEGLRDIAESDLRQLNLPDCGAATPGEAATPTPERADGVCHVGLIVRPGESCSYPGTSTEFSVDSSETGRFLFFTARVGEGAPASTARPTPSSRSSPRPSRSRPRRSGRCSRGRSSWPSGRTSPSVGAGTTLSLFEWALDQEREGEVVGAKR